MMEQAYWVIGRGTGITALGLFTLSIDIASRGRGGCQAAKPMGRPA
jgi:hypothetical protein